jgi:hypothetical protein
MDGTQGGPRLQALYKFVTDVEALPHFLSGLTKFTPIRDLNDPSELVPHVVPDEIRASLDRLKRDGYSDDDIVHLQRQGHLLTRLAPKFLATRVPATRAEADKMIRASFYQSTSTLERLLIATAEEISSRVGLFCLSTRWDSLPMWAHYAGNATGVAIEFQGLEEVFRGDNTGILRAPIAVRYEREHAGVTFETRSHETLFFVKFQDWSYEREVRVVLPLDECEHRAHNGRELYLYQMPRPCISRVVVGWRMPTSKVAEVKARVRASSPGVEVVGARIMRGQVTLVQV